MATDTTQSPSDAELDAVLTEVVGPDGLHADWLAEIGRPCARAVLARWGAAPTGEPVYAFRRKGLDDFCTCDAKRYEELSAKPNLFEVRVFYTAPQPAEPPRVPQPMPDLTQLTERGAKAWAGVDPQALREGRVPQRYRLLERGRDTIEATDEFLQEDGITWQTYPTCPFIGMVYEGDVLLPARRPIPGIKHKEGGQDAD